MKRNRRGNSGSVQAYVVLMLLCATCGGCGGKEPSPVLGKLTPASGTVTRNGEPLAGAIVTFIPDPESPGSGGEVANAVTNSQGRFELVTALPGVPIEESKGAVPGRYVVVISRILMPDGSPLPPGTTEADAMAEGAEESLPAKYSDMEQSVLEADVAGGQANYDFELE